MASLFLTIFFLFSRKTKTITPEIRPNITFKSLIPGQSSKKEVLDTLGNPKKESGLKEGQILLEYDSTNPVYNNTVLIENGSLSLIREMVTLKDNKNAQEIKKVYGEPKYFLYGPDAYAGFFLYIYPENGIAYLGHPETGLLLQIWYFPSTTFDNFKEKYATDYSEKLEPRQ